MNSFLFFLSALPLACICYAQQTVPRKIVLKVNLGGGPVGDFLGEDQVLEMEGFYKTVTRNEIQNTDQQEIFQTQRFARDEDFVMRIPVPDGVYSITLLFAETYEKACKPGGRVFDISLGTPISGTTKVVDSFDLFQAAGCTAAHGKRFDKVPSKGGIVVHLGKKIQHPSLSAFIVEGYPAPKGDGSEYRAVGQPPDGAGTESGQDLATMDGTAPSTGAAFVGAPPAGTAPTGALEEGANEQLAAVMPPTGPGQITNGQQMMQTAQLHQSSGQSRDAGQHLAASGPEVMGAQPGHVPPMPGSMGMGQPGDAGFMGGPQPGINYNA